MSGQYMSLANDDEERPLKRQKLARARPQHKRGVNIQPDLATVSSRSPNNEVEVSRKTRREDIGGRYADERPAGEEAGILPWGIDQEPIAPIVPVLQEVDAVLGAFDSVSSSVGQQQASPTVAKAAVAPTTRITRARAKEVPNAPAQPQTSQEVVRETRGTVQGQRKRKRPDKLRIKVPGAPVEKLPKPVAPSKVKDGNTAVPQHPKTQDPRPRPSQEDPDEWVEKMINTKPKLKQLTANGMTVDIAGYEATIAYSPKDPAKHVDRWLENSDFTRPPSQRSISHPPEPELERVSHVQQDQSPETRSNADREGRSDAVSSRHSTVEDAQPAEPTKDPSRVPAEQTRNPSSMDAMTDSGPDEFRPAAMRHLQHVGRGARGGTWSEEEITLAEDIWNDYMKSNSLRDSDLRLKTINWANIGAIKLQMYEAFPDRTLETIRKFCQRHFTPYKSGPWTEEEDELLRHEYALHPAQWTLISSALMRSPQCVRDRWRNYTQDHATRVTGAWTEEEEHMMGGILKRLWQSMTEDPIADGKTEAELEACIDWNLVNVRMGGTRSARRCYEKWQIMKIRLYAAADPEWHAPDPAPPPDSATDGVARLTKAQRALEKRYSRLGWGDVLDALADITLSMGDDLDQKYQEESTFWSQVAIRAGQAGSKFVDNSKLRRRCYEGALVKVGYYNEVAEAVGIARKAEAMQNILLALEERGKLKLERQHKRKEIQNDKPTEVIVEVVRQAAQSNVVSAQPNSGRPEESHAAEKILERQKESPAIARSSKSRRHRRSRSDKKRTKPSQVEVARSHPATDPTTRSTSTKKCRRRDRIAEMKPPAKKRKRIHDLVNGVGTGKGLSEAMIIDSDED